MANAVYNVIKVEFGKGTINWADSNSVFKCALVTSDYTPDVDNHKHFSDVTNEVSGQGYTAGGAEITGRTVTEDDANDLAKYDADDTTWENSTITARGAVIYKDTGDASTSPLIAYIDFGADQSSDNASFTIKWDPNGIFSIN